MKKAFVYLLALTALVLTACNSYPPDVVPDYELHAGDTTTTIEATTIINYDAQVLTIGQAATGTDRTVEFVRSCGFEALHYALPLDWTQGTTFESVSINGQLLELGATLQGNDYLKFLQDVTLGIRAMNPHVKALVFEVIPQESGFVLWRTRAVLTDFYQWRDITLTIRKDGESICYGLGHI